MFMKNYVHYIYLLFITTFSGSIHAQDLPPYQTHKDNKRKKTTDSIHAVLNHIYKIQNSDPDSALKTLEGLYRLATSIGYLQGMGGASAEIGGTYIVKGDFEKAERYLLYALFFPKLNEYNATNASNNLYLVYESRGQYELALQSLKKAMASKDKNVASVAYNNQITLLLKLGRYKEALYYIHILKDKATVLKQHRVLAAALCNEAATYSALKQYEKFDAITHECLQLCNSHPGLDDIATYCIINSGTSYYERGQTDTAISFFVQVKEAIAELPLDYQMNYYSEYGIILSKTGAHRAAIDMLNKGTTLARKMDVQDQIEPIYYLARSYRALGDHEQAGTHYEHYIALKDSFRNIDIQKNINEYEVKFRTAEKDNELLNKKLLILSQAGKLNRKNTWIILSIAGLATLTALFFAYFKYARQRLLMLKQDLDIVQQQSRINFLKAMMQGEEKERKRIGIELHNGIGSQLTAINLNLTAFQWKNKQVSQIDNLDDIITQIQRTAVEVRKTAHNLLPSNIMELGLFEAIKDFTRQFKPSAVQFNVSKSGDISRIRTSLASLIYRILQELIHNAMKHATATSIDIHLTLDGDLFSATVIDNGKGFDPSGIHRNGVGLGQIQEQLALLKGTFTVDTHPGGGTAVYVAIDLKHTLDD